MCFKCLFVAQIVNNVSDANHSAGEKDINSEENNEHVLD